MNEPQTRRYLFKLYPTAEQNNVLHQHRVLAAELWNALLQRHEDIQRRTVQRQSWRDPAGKSHNGLSIHDPRWRTQRKRNGETAVIEPGKNGRPKPYTDIDMQNEVTWLCNQCPEWREMSVWVGHRTAQKLHRAFEAFYRRMKELSDPAEYERRARKFIERKGRNPTRYELAGYPRYKSTRLADSIPHRFASGCKLVQTPRIGARIIHDHRGQAIGLARHDRSWQLTLKGVPGILHARGALPGEVSDWLDADVMWRDGGWWISVCVKIVRAEQRQAGPAPIMVEFDLIDDMARVNGVAETPPEIVEVSLLQDARDEMQSAHDAAYPRGKRLSDSEKEGAAESRNRLRALSARIARKRNNALHVWTSAIVSRASDITIVAPPVREMTASPRGGERHWGAQIAVVSGLNRTTLAQAPATAIQMLRYKAEEAGIRCDALSDAAPKIAVGSDLVVTGKQLRRARREVKRKAAA